MAFHAVSCAFGPSLCEDHELQVEDLERLVRDYKTKVFVELGAEFPTDPQEPRAH